MAECSLQLLVPRPGDIFCTVCSTRCVTVHALTYGGHSVTVCSVCFLLDELRTIYTDQPRCPMVTQVITAELLEFIKNCTSPGVHGNGN